MTTPSSSPSRPATQVATPTHTNLWRDDLALDLLCAFNGIRRDQIPADDPHWQRFANPSMARAWHRVAEAARSALAIAQGAAPDGGEGG